MIHKIPYFKKGDRLSLDEYPDVVHEVVNIYEEDDGFEYTILLGRTTTHFISEEDLIEQHTLLED